MSSSALGSTISIRRMLTASLHAAAAISLAVLAAGGTYALLSSSASASPTATVRSGTATLAVTSALAMPTTALYPGLTIYGAATLGNTGDVPLAMRVSALMPPTASTLFSQSLTIGIGMAGTVAACQSGSVTPLWTGTFTSWAAATIGSALAVGGNAIVCVSVSMPTGAASGAQGQTAANFVIQLDGRQV